MPTPTPTPTPQSATQLATEIKAKVPTITEVFTVTAANDSNSLLGRPNEYTGAATMHDSRIPAANCDTPDDSTCGAKIEAWPNQAAAQQRSTYIETALKSANGFLGTEYDTVDDGYLLRVDGTLTPAEAAVYASAFKAAITQ